jgi:pyruvate formate lyase activating enzyme
MKALIFKIDRLNTHNGPGFRTVIFFKGCPLHCIWCHNPEGINRKKQIWYISSRCIGCGNCIEVCPEGALELSPKGIEIDPKKCNGCHKCVIACPSKALEKLGEDITTDNLMNIILKDKLYYESSGGGITVTGGEPGIYADFITELFRKCRQNGIQTAFDTSGGVPLNELEPVLWLTDLLFLDLKILDPEKSLIHTGLDVNKLMESVQWLKKFMQINPEVFRLFIRTPMIPDLTNTEKNITEIVELIDKIGEDLIDEWELCGFNNLCADKYAKLKQDWVFKDQNYSIDLNKLYFNLNSHFRKLKIVISGLGVF